MTKSAPMTALERLDTDLHEQTLEVAALRLALDVQSERIALQAELERLPQTTWHFQPRRAILNH